jgi:hypothetical protein
MKRENGFDSIAVGAGHAKKRISARSRIFALAFEGVFLAIFYEYWMSVVAFDIVAVVALIMVGFVMANLLIAMWGNSSLRRRRYAA